MIEIKIGKQTIPHNDIGDEMALLGFCKTKAEIDALSEELTQYKERLSLCAKNILAGSDAATVTIQSGNFGVKVAFGWDITIKDQDALRELLADRFYDLVEEKITQSPSKKLKEMALLDDGLKACLLVKEKTPAISLANKA